MTFRRRPDEGGALANTTPIWRTIYDVLKGEIAAARFKTGDKLPTEAELSQRFAVNRHTVRRALAEMTQEGAIHVRRGSGAYVAEGMVDYRLGARVRFSQNVAELGRTPAHQLVGEAVIPAEEPIARHLALQVGEPVAELDLVSEVDGLPILYAQHFFCARRFPDFAAAFRETASISAALQRYGVADYTRAWTRITARAPGRGVAARLRQPDSQPVLRAEGVNHDMDGRPIEFAVGWWSGARAQFVVEP
jgi:GntR family transcriptional regulator, phosphonate transport system regulatory protein